MSIEFDTKARALVPVAALLPFAALAYAIYTLAHAGSFTHVGTWIYHSAEWLGPAAFVLLLGVFWLVDGPLDSRRPFTYVPLDGAWWELLVFGLVAATVALLFIISTVTAFAVFTILIPIKAIIVYTLGAGATIASALIAIPLAYFGVGLAFTILYLAMLLNGRGNMLKDDIALFPTSHSTGWMPAARDTLFFSLATMIGADTAGVAPTGAVRWVSLAQATVAKALEIVIVGVGITLILNRMGATP